MHLEARLWTIWDAMLDRCENPQNRQWKRYGGRGITVCERWKDFQHFMADMGLQPEGRGLERPELHRIDNDRGYEPGNCKWITQKEHVRHHHYGRELIFYDMMMQM